MLTDIEIARQTKLRPITEIAAQLGLHDDEIEPYGRYKAKISEAFLRRCEDRPDGKLILVTAINPTPAGEGKTTTTIGLGQALHRLGKRAVIALREPSLGPVFGIKGGAAGGGYAQVLPMEDINLHFTGDFHAITAANNLLCAVLDNHIFQGNLLGIDPRRILISRVTDTNDRALRNIVIGLGGKNGGIPREDHFSITVASEVMAILCLSTSMADLKKRLGDILVAYTYDGKPVWCRDLKCVGSMAVLLKDALLPNLVQTTENTPALIHGGPFANIAHGCNSVRATRLALKCGEYAITEAGFGADLGAEKFIDIKCRLTGLRPSAVVLVATVRALKYNGGLPKDQLGCENLDALRAGLCNMEAHIDHLMYCGIPVVVAINRFPTDTQAELDLVCQAARARGASAALSEVFAKGGEGGLALADEVIKACERSDLSQFRFFYEDRLPVKEKVGTLAHRVYGAAEVRWEAAAEKALCDLQGLDVDLSALPICMAKTQYSLSDDPAKLGRPENFTMTVRDIRLSAGAGFLVVLTGTIMTMPGLGKQPAAYGIDINDAGEITGLF